MARISWKRRGCNGGRPIRLENGRAVATAKNGTAIFPVRRSKHFFWAGRGYSIDAIALADAQKDCTEILFIDSEIDRKFRISVKDFLAFSRPVNYGYGTKWVCSEDHYSREGEEEPSPVPAEQQMLFDMPASSAGHYV